MPAEPPLSTAVSRNRRPLVVGAIMLATFMVAMEATIVATAMPRIVGELGGFTYYAWVFSAYLLAQSATTVIYGKLADVFGRKPVLIFGITLFIAGSLLCGFAWSMLSLVVFRLVQGIGAGAIQPVTITVIGDLFSFEERGRAQGMNASVWATSAVTGPLAGALIVEHMSWAWIFWINVPFGVLAIAGFVTFLKETIEPREVSIDYAGAGLFTIAIVSLLVALTETEASATTLALLAAIFVVGGTAFLLQERRAKEPIISIALWGRRLVATINGATLLSGMAPIGLTTVLPIYVQSVMGRSAMVAGFTLTMLIFGWPLAVMLSSRFFRAFGLRRTLRAGGVFLPLGAALLLLLDPQGHPAIAGVASFLMGFGMGLISLTSFVLVQDSVEWSMRASATASVIFSRSLGNTLGATALGAVLNLGIAHYGSGELAAGVHALLNRPDGLARLAADAAVRPVFDQALHLTFWAIIAVALLTCVLIWMVPVAFRPASAAAAKQPAPAD